MTSVAFHFNLDDRLHHSCRLARKGVSLGSKLVVIGPEDVLGQFDQQLWALSATEFVTHCRATEADAMVQRSSVLLCESLNGIAPREVLVNLGQTVPDGFQSYARVLEIVSIADVDLVAARRRWKHYAHMGAEIIKHDLGARPAP